MISHSSALALTLDEIQDTQIALLLVHGEHEIQRRVVAIN